MILIPLMGRVGAQFISCNQKISKTNIKNKVKHLKKINASLLAYIKDGITKIIKTCALL
jgi:hypothetical protein